MTIILVTGASRSGKSEFGEFLATQSNKSVTYVATSILNPEDSEWIARIRIHQQRRPDSWDTISEAIDLTSIIKNANKSQCFLIDSLGTWVANFLDRDNTYWQEVTTNLLPILNTTQADIILIAEETGWGVVPSYKSGRLFRDRLGNLIRTLGNISDTTYLVTGGHVLNLSLLGTPLSKYKL